MAALQVWVGVAFLCVAFAGVPRLVSASSEDVADRMCSTTQNGDQTCSPPPPTCSDLNEGCEDWAWDGQCEPDANAEWMGTNCPRSCGGCASEPKFVKARDLLSLADDDELATVFIASLMNVSRTDMSVDEKKEWVEIAMRAVDKLRYAALDTDDATDYLRCVRLFGEWVMSGALTTQINRASLQELLDDSGTYDMQAFSYAGVPGLTHRVKYGLPLEMTEFIKSVVQDQTSNVDTGFGTSEASKRAHDTAKQRNVPIVAFHQALPRALADVLHTGFHPDARYWKDTHYAEVDRKGFYSWWYDYKNSHPQNAIEQVFDYLVKHYIPEEDRGRIIGGEMWVHARKPALGGLNGHPCHYDHDEHYIFQHGVYRSPLWSSLLFIEAAGGPTIVTDISPSDQDAKHRKMTRTNRDARSWLAFPENNTFIVFNGTKSHCVLPDAQRAADKNKHRITLMFGFWADECSHASPQGPCAFLPRTAKQGLKAFDLRKNAKWNYKVDVGVTPKFDWLNDFPVVNDDQFFLHQEARSQLPYSTSLPRMHQPGYTSEYPQFDFEISSMEETQ
eukprot:m.485804 g.485804  ORF g.485804 m.485804 type:complete len:560 (-) comp23991_c0_seq1:151-1830(-)